MSSTLGQLAQLTTQNLADIGFGKLSHKDDLARHLVARQFLAAEGDYVLGACFGKGRLDNIDAQRLCMLTGARVGEVRQARFEHFNLEHLSWSKPASMTKQRRIHRLPISDEAAAIVRQRQILVPRGCQLLFPGDVPGQPVKEIRNFWKRIQKQVGIKDVRIHDLRHTFASLLVSGGASLEMIGKLLGHSQTQTTQRYAHLMDSPLRAGVDAVASAFQPKPVLVHDVGDQPRKSA